MLLCKAHQCGRGLQQSRNRKFACARAGLVLDAYASCSLASLGASREYAELEVAFVGVWAEGGDPLVVIAARCTQSVTHLLSYRGASDGQAPQMLRSFVVRLQSGSPH